jgi:hypothetical protein
VNSLSTSRVVFNPERARCYRLSCLTGKHIIWVLLVFIVALFSLDSFADLRFAPTVDGFVRVGNVTNPTTLKPGVYDYAGGPVVVGNYSGYADHGIMEFNVAGSYLSSDPVTLNLPIIFSFDGRDSAPYPWTVDLFGYAGDGTLSMEDYGAGSLLGSRSFHFGISSLDFDVTQFLKQLQSDNDMFAGFSIRLRTGVTSEDGPLIAFGSLEGGSGYGPATLVFVPEPTTSLLAVLGSVGLFGIGWRRSVQVDSQN